MIEQTDCPKPRFEPQPEFWASKLASRNNCQDWMLVPFISGMHHPSSAPTLLISSLSWDSNHTESRVLPTWQWGLVGPLPATVGWAVIRWPLCNPLYSFVSAGPIKTAALLTQLPAYGLWQVTTEVISTNPGDIYHKVGIPAENWLRPINLFLRVLLNSFTTAGTLVGHPSQAFCLLALLWEDLFFVFCLVTSQPNQKHH